MSGYSKWVTTKHKKAAIDAECGELFVRFTKNTEVMACTGGGDPVGSPTLFDAIQKAKKSSVPADNITCVVKCDSGAEAGGANYETIMHEGYGPGGVTFYVECLTDNRNRAASDVRPVFTRSGGLMANPGSVVFLFSRRGIVEIAAAESIDEDSTTEAVLETGTEEVEDLGDGFVIESDPSDVAKVRKALQAVGIDYDSAEVQLVAAAEVKLDLEGAVKIQCLVDALEDSDDVQNIYHNMTASDEVRTQLEEKE